MQYLNLHTHQPTGVPGVLEIESVFYGQDIVPQAGYRSAGLHPWHLDGIDLAAAEQWLRVQAVLPDMLAIGEAGLDKLTQTPWSVQLDAFELCLRIAVDTGKPLIVHCVKAYGEIMHLLSRPPAIFHRLPAVIFHGFDKHPQTAQMLLHAGCFLSFGAALFREDGHAAESLRQTPSNRYFLETDVQKLDIKAVYARAAEIRRASVAEIQAQVWDNFETRINNR